MNVSYRNLILCIMSHLGFTHYENDTLKKMQVWGVWFQSGIGLTLKLTLIGELNEPAKQSGEGRDVERFRPVVLSLLFGK